jgi:hypothetical protein
MNIGENPIGKTFTPGYETWYACDSPVAAFTVIFEDDGETACFYAYDRANESRILDAVQIYAVHSVVDKNMESVAEIVWSADGMKAALFINGYPHAIVNFAERSSYCRTGFPTPPSDWGRGRWSEDLLEWFSAQ